MNAKRFSYGELQKARAGYRTEGDADETERQKTSYDDEPAADPNNVGRAGGGNDNATQKDWARLLNTIGENPDVRRRFLEVLGRMGGKKRLSFDDVLALAIQVTQQGTGQMMT